VFGSFSLPSKRLFEDGATEMREKRSVCPNACTLDLIGDKWTLLVVRDLLLGRQHFKEFSCSPEKIATNILSDRLARLEENEIVERFPSSEHPGRNAYRLTRKGKSLKSIIKPLIDWGLKNIEGTEARLQPK